MVNVSVIIPTYKRVEQTLKTIALLHNSEGKNGEFSLEIIVADSTPDNSLRNSLTQAFGSTVLYLKPEILGIAANKNAGAKMASGQVLIFCDSDIEVEKDTVTETVRALQRYPKAGAVMGEVVWKGGDESGQRDRPREEDRQVVVDQTTFIEAIYSRYMATYKEIFFDVGGYDQVLFNMRGEGSDLSVRYWRSGYPLVFEKSIRVHHLFEAPDSAALRVPHPEWGVAKDMLLLAMKYDMLEGSYPNFAKTIARDFAHLGDESYLGFLQGIGNNMSFLSQVNPIVQERNEIKQPRFPFTFLEVFSDQANFEACIREADGRLSHAHKHAFRA